MTVPICTLATSLGIASLFAGSLIGGTTALHAAPGDKIGSAVSIINTVTVALAKEKRGLATGDSVRQDELVEVSADSLGEFRLDDDTKLALGPGARLRLDKFVYDPDRKVGTIVVNLVKGTFRFMTGIVTGFGCRPHLHLATRTTGPAFESRQGRKARDWGTRLSERYGDLAVAVGAAGAVRCRQRWRG